MAVGAAAGRHRGFARGELIEDTVHGAALSQNLLGDIAERNVLIYLPPSYRKLPGSRYPVIYILHGYQSSYENWRYLGSVLDSLIATEQSREMIVVVLDCNNKYGGSFYTKLVRRTSSPTSF